MTWELINEGKDICIQIAPFHQSPAGMRLTPSLLVPALCWQLASASSPSADVYLFDPNRPQEPRPDRTLSPITARLVLAQRAGVEDFHSADLYDKDVIQAINDYGVRTPLFSQQPGDKDGLRTALILVDGLEGEDGTIATDHQALIHALITNHTQLPNTKHGPNSPTSKSPLYPPHAAHKSSGTT